MPRAHPSLQLMVDPALGELRDQLNAMHATQCGRPSVAPENLRRGLLLHMLYKLRSEQQLIEQLDYNPFRVCRGKTGRH